MAVRFLNLSKRDLAERALGASLGLLSDDPAKNAKRIVSAVDKFARGDKQATTREYIRSWLEEGKPGREMITRLIKNTHPNVRRQFIARLVVSMFFRQPDVNEQCLEKYGITSPHVTILSPTMRCNLRCEGCYAASYERKDDMPADVFDRVISECEEIGTNFFVLVGGEPFIYPDLLDILKKHNKSVFQIYTNGTFIDRDMAKRLVKMGNIAPQLSVNGPAEFNDASRGKGSFDRSVGVMDILREEGCVFGFSSLITRHNVDAICSEEWIDFLISKGIFYGWLFLYMPVGRDPDTSLMPTPEQRDQLRVAMRHYRQTKPIMPIDFWNDGPMCGGCISGGREYFHINHKGDVEPCIFNHFATHNVHDCSVAEALASPFFKTIRESIPFSYNTLRPCPILDHHQAMWSIIQECGAKPTHEGADKMFTTLAPEMKKYSAGVAEIMDDVWDNEDYHDWAAKWGSQCGCPTDRWEARRQAYEISRGRKPE